MIGEMSALQNYEGNQMPPDANNSYQDNHNYDRVSPNISKPRINPNKYARNVMMNINAQDNSIINAPIMEVNDSPDLVYNLDI